MRLTEWTTCGGCAAKWGGAPLRTWLEGLGLAEFDDAAVVPLDEHTALVSTTDFFPPLVDDPDDFGAIAAANACSDVFAMGGRVVLALNVAAFPEDFPPDVAATIFSAAADTVAAAGGLVAGGHTIRAPEPLFGLAVQGLVHPDRVWTKGGARPGDVLVLSKPIGTGIVLAAGDPPAVAAATSGMRALNLAAAETLTILGDRVHACTDVTGYGLAGHGWEMAERSDTRVRIEMDAVPLYEGALAAVSAGVRTGGDARNREYAAAHVTSSAPAHLEALAFDPQTSGGLLATLDPSAPVPDGFTVIGVVEVGDAGVVLA